MPISEKIAACAIQEYLRESSENDSLKQIHLCGCGAIAELESKLKRFYGMRHAICVSNATTGLMALAMTLELRHDEFISSPYTYGATLSGWLLRDNKVIFADIDNQTLAVDCNAVVKAITTKTKAILAVDIFGIPHDSAGMRKIADQYGLWYIADCAQSLGATRFGNPSGLFSDALVVSFTVGKSVFAGEGAAILTDNESLYQKLLWHTQHPLRQKKELGLSLSNEFGLNARIHPLAAVWANAVWENEFGRLAKHQKDCYQIIRCLNGIGLTEKISFAPDKINPSFTRLTASWRRAKAKEENLIKELKACGAPMVTDDVPVNIIYKQPSFLTQFRKNISMKTDCAHAEKQSQRRFCLVKVQ